MLAKGHTVFQTLLEASINHGDRVAIYDEYGSLSFNELFDEIELLQKKLQHLGVGKSFGLGLMARNSREFIIALLAGAACEATVMPISHRLKSSELNELLKVAPLHGIIDDGSGVTPPGTSSEHLNCQTKQLRFTKIRDQKSAFISIIDDAAFIRFTSGTTGAAKGVILSHKSVLERIEAAQKALQLQPDDTVLWVLPMAFHFVVSIILYVRYGITIAICRDELAQTLIQTGQQYSSTYLYAAPVHYRTLAEDSSREKISSLRRAISTSSAISEQVADAFQNRFKQQINQVYGIIELGLPAGNLEQSKYSSTSIGSAFPGYEIQILSEQLRPVEDGIIGQLAIKGPGMFDAYMCPATKRQDVLQNSWFLTGDLALKNNDGSFTVAGRKKSVINFSGQKVFPEEVEAVLNSHSAVEISRVYGSDHPNMGEVVSADLVLKDGIRIKKEDLYKFCREHLSNYKIPQQIDFVSSISMTGSGKVQRH